MRSVVIGLFSACIAVAACVALADEGKGSKPFDEKYRPQFHFTAAKNWLNDPNGMVFYRGEYHLFFQHNPKDIKWGNMTWGHAVSPDMFHWTQLDHAIHPDKFGTIWSGSAIVDWNNTTGFQSGDEKPLVCIFTYGGDVTPGLKASQALAYSNDGGRTFTKYDKNPVLPNIVGVNRDPKVFWHEPSKKWVMALFLDGHDYALFGSPDLKQWTKLCDVPMPDADECPDMFQLPVDGDPKNTKWVFWGANNTYLLGDFDGTTFTKDAGPLRLHFGKNRYAAQTFSDIPASDGRRLQIAWMSGAGYPGMPFNQQMSLPVSLTLRTFPDGVRLCAEPAKEVESLREKRHAWSDLTVKPGENPLNEIEGDLFDIRLNISAEPTTDLTLKIRGTPIEYNFKDNKLTCLGKSATIGSPGGVLDLRVLVDRTSIEIFSGDGRVIMAYCFLPPEKDKSLQLSVAGGDAKIRSLEVWELKSAWRK